MRNSFISSAAALGVVLLAAGCGSSTGPGGGLTQSQQQALDGAIATSGLLGPEAGQLAPYIIAAVGATGSISGSLSGSFSRSGGISADVSNVDGTWDAAGVQVVFSASLGSAGSIAGAYSGVVGWNFNSAGTAVTDLIQAGALNETANASSAPGAETYGIGGDPTQATAGVAAYWDGTTTFTGAQGSFVLNSASFGGSSTDCPAISTGTQATVTCSFTAGTMSGSFNFAGIDLDNPTDTYNQATTTFSSLPSVTVSLTITQ